MNNRLQFIRCEKLFPTREEAIAYAKERRSNGDLTLFGEPLVLKYGETESTAHIILGIGANTNKTGYLEDNRICFIDIDHTESEIADLHQELQDAIEALVVNVTDTNTLSLKKEEVDGKSVISGEVKLAGHQVVGDRVVPNILTSNEDGLFVYVNLEYDAEHNKFVFTVNGDRKEMDIVQEPFVVGGFYDVTDESLHMTKNDGSEAVVPLKELIGEWKTEGEASMTPIVLTKSEIAYDEGIHTARHQDLLQGDVRVATDMPNNILEKVQNGRALYVNGSASNIKVWVNGHETSLQNAVEDSALCPVSSDYGNMIYKKQDGIFADSNLEYNEHENKLIFTKTNGSGEVLRREIDLVGVELFKNIWYDAAREVLVLQYTDNKGILRTVEIPVGQLITEWDVRNGETNVTLAKTRNVTGQDLLTANVNIASQNDFADQILEERNHKLLVRGTAINIKYRDTTVKDALDLIGGNVGEMTSQLQSVEDKIGSGFTDSPVDNITHHFQALESEFDTYAQDSTAALDELTDKTNTLNTALNEEVSRSMAQDNALAGKLDAINLEYDSNTNTLVFTKDGGSVRLPLMSTSFITDIRYNPDTEEIEIYYNTADGHTGVSKVNVKNLITEWDVENPSNSPIELIKSEHVVDGHDKLSAQLRISVLPNNLAQIVDNALFVDGTMIGRLNDRVYEVETNLTSEITRARVAEDGLRAVIDSETLRAEESESRLGTAISAETRRAEERENQLEYSINQTTSDVNHLISRVQDKIDNETTRATDKETELAARIDSEELSRLNRDDELDAAIRAEESRARIAETDIQNRLVDAVANAEVAHENLQGLLREEAATSRERDTQLDIRINNEITRAQDVETRLQNQINANEFTPYSTPTLSLVKNGENLRGDVKIANANENIIKINDNLEGLYAMVDLSYNGGTNTLTFTTSNETKSITLNAGSIVDNISYDTTDGKRDLVITYHSMGDSTPKEVRVDVSALFNEWKVQEGNHLGAIILNKYHEGDVDVLSGSVSISTNEHNILVNDNGNLFVDGSGIQEAVDGVRAVTGQVAGIQEEIDKIETGAGLSGDGSYIPSVQANYINRATSLADATEKLDTALKVVEEAVSQSGGEAAIRLNELSAKTVTEIVSHDDSITVVSEPATDGTVKYDITVDIDTFDCGEYEGTIRS